MNRCTHRAAGLGICCHPATNLLPDLLTCRDGSVPPSCPVATARPRATLIMVGGVVTVARVS